MSFYMIPGVDQAKGPGIHIVHENRGRCFYPIWKPNPEATLDEIENSMHNFTEHLKSKYGADVVDVNECQPGYVDFERLDKYPDDASVVIYIATPFGTRDNDSITNPALRNYSKEDIDRLSAMNDGLFKGELIAESWETSTLKGSFKRFVLDEINLYWNVVTGQHNPDIHNTYQGFMYHTGTDVGQNAMNGLGDVFWDEIMPKKYSDRKSRYVNPAIWVFGEEDNIVTMAMGTKMLECIGTSQDMIAVYVLPGGHLGVFNSGANFKEKNGDYPTYPQIFDKVEEFLFRGKRIDIQKSG